MLFISANTFSIVIYDYIDIREDKPLKRWAGISTSHVKG